MHGAWHTELLTQHDSYGYYCYHIPVTDNQGKVTVIAVGATSTFFFFFF